MLPCKAISRLALLILPLSLCLLACSSSLASDPTTDEVAAKQAASEPAMATSEEAKPAAVDNTKPGANCAGGAIKDDGTVETGYGFVPQATDGVYIQEFDSSEFSSRAIESVCVCWLKTEYTRDVDFDVVFYQAAGNVPASEPYATVAARATALADSVETAGAFYDVDISDVEIPEGKSYIGVRWNPNKAKFLFVCTDTTGEREKVNVFFREDMAPSWTNVMNSMDPIFAEHRSILLRARAAEKKAKPPAKPVGL